MILEVRVLHSIWNMQAGLQAPFVISERPYNLEVDLLLKLVGRDVCHMFSIHKYWLWLSCWLSLTLVGFHFGAQPRCNVSHLPTISFMPHVHVLSITLQSCFCCQTHVDWWWSFYWFPNKKTALLKRWIRGESKQQIAHLVLELHLRGQSHCWFVSVCSCALKAEECGVRA